MSALKEKFKKNLKTSQKDSKKDTPEQQPVGLFHDPWNRLAIILAAVANLIAWLLVLVLIKELPEPVILHYNSYFGIDREGAFVEALLIPVSGLLIFLTNLGLSFFFYKRKPALLKILLGISLICNLFINIALAALIFVNQV